MGINNLILITCRTINQGIALEGGKNTRENVRSQVSKAITAGGGIVLSVKMKGESLEDAFIELLKPHSRETKK